MDFTALRMSRAASRTVSEDACARIQRACRTLH